MEFTFFRMNQKISILFYKKEVKSWLFSHLTAIKFYNLSDRIPHIIDITVTNEYRGSLQDKKDVNLFRIKKEFINLGSTVDIDTTIKK